MLIGDRYSDSKLYRGIKYHDGYPLTSGDLHEMMDILSMKDLLFMNNAIGLGTLNKPNLSKKDKKVSLSEPSVLLLDGDIVLIYSDTPIINLDNVDETIILNGYLCVVGWYQEMKPSSKLHYYGGLNNQVIDNDILNSKFSVENIHKYQFVWDTVLIEKEIFDSSGDISIIIPSRTIDGDVEVGKRVTLSCRKENNIRKANTPASMTYAASDIYIVPIISYEYEEGAFKTLSAMRSISVGSTSLAQDRNVVILDTSTDIASDIRVDIGISKHNSNSALQVSYNGIVLVEGTNYILSSDHTYITLLGFTTRVGDEVTFISTRIV